MTRNLRALGLALLAVLALGAVAAQGASAAGEKFHSDGEKTNITGENIGKEKFTVGGAVECEKSKFEGTEVGEVKTDATHWTSDTLTIKPTYGNEDADKTHPQTGSSECNFGQAIFHWNMNDCAYIFGSSTSAAGHAGVEVECAAGHQIELDITGVCTITVGPQNITTGGVRFVNKTSSSIEVIWTMEKIVVGKKATTSKATGTTDQTGCPLIPTGAVGKYTGTSTMKCFRDDDEKAQSDPTTPNPATTVHGPTTDCSHS